MDAHKENNCKGRGKEEERIADETKEDLLSNGIGTQITASLIAAPIATVSDIEDQEEDCEEERSLLKDVETENDSTQHSSSCCSWNLAKKLIMMTSLWISYFLCSMAFSTIAPFLPMEVSCQKTKFSHHVTQ